MKTENSMKKVVFSNYNELVDEDYEILDSNEIKVA